MHYFINHIIPFLTLLILIIAINHFHRKIFHLIIIILIFVCFPITSKLTHVPLNHLNKHFGEP